MTRYRHEIVFCKVFDLSRAILNKITVEYFKEGAGCPGEGTEHLTPFTLTLKFG